MDAAEDVRQGRAKKIRSRAHEGVAEVAVVGPILHFLREDVARVGAPRDVENIERDVPGICVLHVEYVTQEFCRQRTRF